MQKFIINGRLNGLNEYTNKNRRNPYAGAKMKKDNETIVIYYIKRFKLKKVDKYPIKIKIDWYEKNRKRDIDNITFATKFILDGIVKAEIMQNDSQKYVNEIEHHIYIDKDNPRVEVSWIYWFCLEFN